MMISLSRHLLLFVRGSFFLSNRIFRSNYIMWQLSNKLHKIRSDIRKQQLASLMRRQRSELMRSNDEAILKELIDVPIQQFGEYELKRLVEFINKDMFLAIAHLGNLVIDRVLTAQILEAQEWRIGNDDLWAWLINAFIEIGYCPQPMLEYCMRRIITKKSSSNLENALDGVLKAFKLGPACLEYFRNGEVVLALANHVFDSSERISQLVLSIFTSATSYDEQLPQFIMQSLGEARLVKFLQHGLMKIQTGHRAQVAQIANNFLLSGFQLEPIRLRLLELATSQKQPVKLELSYYLKAFAETASEQTILIQIKRSRLLDILKAYSNISSKNPRYDHEISKNAIEGHATIMRRFSASSEQPQKMTDESELYTASPPSDSSPSPGDSSSMMTE